MENEETVITMEPVERKKKKKFFQRPFIKKIMTGAAIVGAAFAGYAVGAASRSNDGNVNEEPGYLPNPENNEGVEVATSDYTFESDTNE